MDVEEIVDPISNIQIGDSGEFMEAENAQQTSASAASSPGTESVQSSTSYNGKPILMPNSFRDQLEAVNKRRLSNNQSQFGKKTHQETPGAKSSTPGKIAPKKKTINTTATFLLSKEHDGKIIGASFLCISTNA